MAVSEAASTAERNKTLFRGFVDAWNSGDAHAMQDFWSPRMVHHDRVRDCRPDEVFALMSTFMAAFPDLRFEIEDLIADGDLVAARMTARATHRGEFMGLPPTGKPIAVSVMGEVRIEDRHIVEHWNVMDEVHLLQQLGLAQATFFDAAP
jgi:C-1 hydroxylase